MAARAVGDEVEVLRARMVDDRLHGGAGGSAEAHHGVFGVVHGIFLDLADIERINRWATGDLRPDLTVLLDLDPERGVGEKDDLDRLERLGDEFHARVREGFLALAARDPERYLVLHARDSEDDIAAAVRARVAGLLAGLKYPGIGVAANVGVIVYFLCAAYAHYRANFLKQEFWLNCLGMLGLSVGVFVLSYVI